MPNAPVTTCSAEADPFFWSWTIDDIVPGTARQPGMRSSGSKVVIPNQLLKKMAQVTPSEWSFTPPGQSQGTVRG